MLRELEASLDGFNASEYLQDYKNFAPLDFFEKYYKKIPTNTCLKESSMQLNLILQIDATFDIFSRPDVNGIFLFSYKKGYEVF